jgi:hypothetical protein
VTGVLFMHGRPVEGGILHAEYSVPMRIILNKYLINFGIDAQIAVAYISLPSTFGF